MAVKIIKPKAEKPKAEPKKQRDGRRFSPTRRGYPAKTYTRLLQYIAEGETLTQACAHLGMPTRYTVNRRTETDEVFRDAYNAALDTSIRNMTEDLPNLAQRALEGQVKVSTADRIAAAKLQSDNIKWLASKRLDQYKGDNEGGSVVFNVTGAAALPPVTQPDAVQPIAQTTPLKIVKGSGDAA